MSESIPWWIIKVCPNHFHSSPPTYMQACVFTHLFIQTLSSILICYWMMIMMLFLPSFHICTWVLSLVTSTENWIEAVVETAVLNNSLTNFTPWSNFLVKKWFYSDFPGILQWFFLTSQNTYLINRTTVNGCFCSIDNNTSIHLRMAVLFVWLDRSLYCVIAIIAALSRTSNMFFL